MFPIAGYPTDALPIEGYGQLGPHVDFLAALSWHLSLAPGILAELGGMPKVYVERATTRVGMPYVLIEGMTTAAGMVEESETVEVEINAYAASKSVATRLHRAIVLEVEPPGINEGSARTGGPLSWAGGTEETAYSKGGHPQRMAGFGPAGESAWCYTGQFEFAVTAASVDGQAMADVSYGPSPLLSYLGSSYFGFYVVFPVGVGVGVGGAGGTEGALDLLDAIVGYLRGSTALTAALGGPDRVFLDMTTAGISRPFVVLERPNEAPGEDSMGDGRLSLSVAVQATNLDQAGSIFRLVRDLLESPNASLSSRRAAPFIWDGGFEEAVLAGPSAPELLPGAGPGGVDVWSWAGDYDFWTADDSDTGRFGPVATQSPLSGYLGPSYFGNYIVFPSGDAGATGGGTDGVGVGNVPYVTPYSSPAYMSPTYFGGYLTFLRGGAAILPGLLPSSASSFLHPDYFGGYLIYPRGGIVPLPAPPAPGNPLVAIVPGDPGGTADPVVSQAVSTSFLDASYFGGYLIYPRGGAAVPAASSFVSTGYSAPGYFGEYL